MLAGSRPKGVEPTFWQRLQPWPVFPQSSCNLAVCRPDSLVCEVSAALRRGEKQRLRASDCARDEFSIHLKNSQTATLLRPSPADSQTPRRHRQNAESARSPSGPSAVGVVPAHGQKSASSCTSSVSIQTSSCDLSRVWT